jgi:pyridoxal biosynthesis lyase PdxS
MAITIPVMAKARIGHFAEAQVSTTSASSARMM